MSYTPVLKFPIMSADFALGFEAGVIWGALTGGARLEGRIVHVENRQLILDMCLQKNQLATFEELDETRLMVTTRLIPNAPSETLS